MRHQYLPNKTALAWARKQEKEGDLGKVNNFRNFSERRWIGFLGEGYFSRWLKDRHIVHQRNAFGGGPDFWVVQTGVGIKTCGAAGDFTPNHVVNIYERHRERSPEEVFFVGHVGLAKVSAIVMLGGMRSDEFFDRADFIAKGEKINPTTHAENDVWNMRVGDLESPDVWLKRVTGFVPQEVDVTCAYERHRPSDWRRAGEGGHWVCGICHPCPFPEGTAIEYRAVRAAA